MDDSRQRRAFRQRSHPKFIRSLVVRRRELIVRTKLKIALPALIVLSVAGMAFALNGSSASAYPASVPEGLTSSAFKALNALRPDAWITPINITHNPNYDNGPGTAGIAASQTDSAVTIVWGRA